MCDPKREYHVVKGRQHKGKQTDTEYQLYLGGIQNGRPENGISVWDRTSIKYTTHVITTSGLSAAMLDLMVVDNASSVALHFLALAGPNSMVIAYDIYILSHIQPEIWELPF